jgi:hypothetical protein
LSWGRAALKQLNAQNVEQANQANHYQARDGKTDGAFKQHGRAQGSGVGGERLGGCAQLNTKV